MTDFNNLPWHDAELKEIVLARDQNDGIKLFIRWPEGYGGQCVCIEFFDCYAFQADMHFGFFPPDFILGAKCIQQSQELDKVNKTWEKMNLDISGLKCYTITTNSTNSTISIYALGFRVTEVPS